MYSYWNSKTLSDIIENGKLHKNLRFTSNEITVGPLPKTIDVCGTEVSIICSNTTNGELSDSSIYPLSKIL